MRLGRSAVHSCSNLLIAFADVRQREAADVLYFISFVMNFAREYRKEGKSERARREARKMIERHVIVSIFNPPMGNGSLNGFIAAADVRSSNDSRN